MNRFFTYKEFLFEKEKPAVAGHSLIMEGGAAGHMSHPFDNKSLTFGDFKNLIESGLRGELNFEEDPTEKTDGQNVFATVKGGVVLFARNKTQLMAPLDLDGITAMFADHPSELVKDTFTLAARDLAANLPKLKQDVLDKYFNDGKSFMNMELIYSKNPNVIHYDVDAIQFHGIMDTDGEGNIIGGNPKAAKEITSLLDNINARVGDTFEIIPPRVIQLRKDVDFEQNKSKFLAKVESLKKRYGLSDSDEVSRYHEMWWREQIESTFSDLPQEVKEGLLLRWAYGDKKTLDMRAVAKVVDKNQLASIKKFDKEDVKKKYKENIEPFEDLFLELGSIILKNASNFLAVSPDKEMQRLHNEIRTEADKIKRGGDEKQIKKVEDELKRLDRIGGIESIVPTEGLVFRYKGHTYKLTGTFAAINQLMGIIKYGR